MIKIEKSKTIPKVLQTKGVAKAGEHCAECSNDLAAHETGEKKISFDRRIYGHRSVKEALKKAQYDKCCYCESKIGSTCPGDVEHFRPKTMVQNGPRELTSYPGYYWLAYDWSNLFLCCEICNRSHKRNLFPLTDFQNRARNHEGNVSDEEPVFVDPGLDDPREHICFHLEVPMALSEKGKKSISYLGLRRPPLEEERKEKLAVLEVLIKLVALVPVHGSREFHSLASEAMSQLRKAIQKQAKFSSMAIDLVSKSSVDL